MSCHIATFAKDLGEVMSCRVATFARSLETYDINICLDPDDIYAPPKLGASVRAAVPRGARTIEARTIRSPA